jgi:hypothetical protein
MPRAAKKWSQEVTAHSNATFYINLAGSGLGKGRKRTLDRAKDELRALYHKEPRS